MEWCSSTNGTGVLDLDIAPVEEASFARFFGDSSALIGAKAGRAERSEALDGPGNCESERASRALGSDIGYK